MARRRRGRRNNNNNITMILIAAVVLVGLGWLISKMNISGESPCGSREEDKDKPGFCVPNSGDYDELIIVSGNTQNSPAPNLDFQKDKGLKDILTGVFYSVEDRDDYPKVQIVSASGANNTINFSVRSKPAKNLSASNNELKRLANGISKAVKTSPSAAGANYLGGIMYAKRLVSNSSKNPLILVVGSGYSDSGILDFTKDDLLNKSEDDIKSILAQSGVIEKDALKGKTVYWYNMGEVVAPQASMKLYVEKTQSVYSAAFNYLGAKNQKLDFNIGVSDNTKSVESKFTVQQVYVDELKVGDIISVNENIGEFYENSYVLKNPDNVRRSLRQFTSKYNINSNLKLKLTGYIATCVQGGTVGYDRANTIKDILIELGIPADRIETHGQHGLLPVREGQEFSCEDENDLPASENRTVMIEVIEG